MKYLTGICLSVSFSNSKGMTEQRKETLKVFWDWKKVQEQSRTYTQNLGEFMPLFCLPFFILYFDNLTVEFREKSHLKLGCLPRMVLQFGNHKR